MVAYICSGINCNQILVQTNRLHHSIQYSFPNYTVLQVAEDGASSVAANATRDKTSGVYSCWYCSWHSPLSGTSGIRTAYPFAYTRWCSIV
jgi:hypothetical protein